MTMTEHSFLPYGRQHITDDDIAAVAEVLRSDWLTQGPAVPAFEDALADYLGARETVACTSGTAALHLAMLALGLGPDDAVITSPITFVATANSARFVGAQVHFADVDRQTGLIDVDSIARLLERDTSGKIKAILPVHLAGQPADLPAIYDLARKHGTWVVDDACHAIGATYEFDGRTHRIGGNPHSDMTVFSFHPVKHVAMGEGGAVSTDHPEMAERMRLFRCHGITRRKAINDDMAVSEGGVPNPWYYEMEDLGFNYRLTDMQAALGNGQLKRLPLSLERRRQIAGRYRELLSQRFSDDEVTPLTCRPEAAHAYHLFIVAIDFAARGISRAVVMNRLRARGIGTQVHYIPVHLQPYYRRVCGTAPGYLPEAEAYYEQALSLPMYPELTDDDIERVVDELETVLMAVGENMPSERQHERQSV